MKTRTNQQYAEAMLGCKFTCFCRHTVAYLNRKKSTSINIGKWKTMPQPSRFRSIVYVRLKCCRWLILRALSFSYSGPVASLVALVPDWCSGTGTVSWRLGQTNFLLRRQTDQVYPCRRPRIAHLRPAGAKPPPRSVGAC